MDRDSPGVGLHVDTTAHFSSYYYYYYYQSLRRTRFLCSWVGCTDLVKAEVLFDCMWCVEHFTIACDHEQEPTQRLQVQQQHHSLTRVCERGALTSVCNYRISSNRSRVSYTSRVCNRSRGSKSEYTARLVGLPGISLCSNKYKTQNLGVLNTSSSVNRVVLIEAGSLIEAGGFY